MAINTSAESTYLIVRIINKKYNPTAKLQNIFRITAILYREVFEVNICIFEEKAFTLQQIKP
jgi:hypothetical protein